MFCYCKNTSRSISFPKCSNIFTGTRVTVKNIVWQIVSESVGNENSQRGWMKGLDASNFSYWSLLLWNTTRLLFCSSWHRRDLSVQWLATRRMNGIRLGPRTYIRYRPRTFLISTTPLASATRIMCPQSHELNLTANLHVIPKFRKQLSCNSLHAFVFRCLTVQKSVHVVPTLLICTKILLRHDYTVFITSYCRLAWIRPSKLLSIQKPREFLSLQRVC